MNANRSIETVQNGHARSFAASTEDVVPPMENTDWLSGRCLPRWPGAASTSVRCAEREVLVPQNVQVHSPFVAADGRDQANRVALYALGTGRLDSEKGARMAEQSGVFLLQGVDSLIAMEPAQFAKEDDFQRLLSRFPALLVGDQIDPVNPRRWVLVKREQTVSTGEVGASQWSIDHVFLDQDGIPTLVEVKRQSDSRLRREVVGQMLDYAANCSTYWSVDVLRSSFEMTCKESACSAEEALSELIGPDGDIESFWGRVQTNLSARRIRLLFVADVIPIELRRVVEFLNEQMEQTEVLAIELRQFQSQSLKTIVPTVYGQRQETPKSRATAGVQWDEGSLFAKLQETVGGRGLQIAKRVFDWMKEDGKRELVFGKGKVDGTVYPAVKIDGVRITPFYLSSDGKVWFQFGALENKPVFGPLAARRALMDKLNVIEGVNFSDADLTRYRAIPLLTIANDPEGESKLIAALDWMKQQLDSK